MTKFNHDIRIKNWRTSEPTRFLAEKTFRVAFSKPAFEWFEKTVLAEYPDAKKIIHNVWHLGGYHFEIDDLIIELR